MFNPVALRLSSGIGAPCAVNRSEAGAGERSAVQDGKLMPCKQSLLHVSFLTASNAAASIKYLQLAMNFRFQLHSTFTGIHA
jgi:hypothetical protein